MDDLERGHDQEVSDGADLELLRRAGPRRPAPLEREARVRAAVRDHWERQVAARKRWPWWWVAAPLAAAALVAVAFVAPLLGPTARPAAVAVVEAVTGTAVMLENSGTRALGVGAELIPFTIVESGGGGRVALRLAGGASLRLDADSRVVVEAGDECRLERGALYVDSGPDGAARGVVIAAAFAEIRDVGTQFEVRILEDAVRVRVREGTVLLRSERREAAVSPSTEAVLRGDGALTTRSFPSYGPEWSWVLAAAPTFRLEGSTAGAFLRWAARETGLELRWAAPQLEVVAEGMTLHGDIRGVSPDEAPKVVLPTCGLASTIVDGTVLLIEYTAR